MAPARRIPLALLLGVALVGALEVALRLAGFGGSWPQPFEFESWEDQAVRPGMFVTHPERFFALAPGFRFSGAHAGRYATGEWPFRGRPPGPAPEGILRVAVLGDSCAYGLTLFPSETIPHRIGVHLAARGLDPTRVQVLNFGNPAYSTVQIHAVLEEVLARHAPDEVVLYPAAWNDQAPALGRDDLELREARSGPSLARRLRATAIGEAIGALVPGAEPAITDGARPRVPPGAVGVELRAMLARCAAAATPVTVIVPPHPRGTAESHPRLIQDEETVRRVATEAGARVVDGPALFAREGRDPAVLMTDIVHPSPAGAQVLAREVAAGLLRGAQPGEPPPAGPVEVVCAAPTSTMGDVSIEVRLEDWREEDGVPILLVGGALVLDLEELGAGGFTGVLQADVEGEHGLLVQAPSRCLWLPGAVERRSPTLEPHLSDAGPGAAPPPTLLLRSRQGDRGRAWFSRAVREEPLWTEHGAIWLDQAGILPLSLDLEAGRETRFDPSLLPGDVGEVVHVQAMVYPPGEPDDSKAAFWSEPIEIRLGPR